MRLHCFHCGQSVSTEVPDGTVLRAVAECPECTEKNFKQKEDKLTELEILLDGIKGKCNTAYRIINQLRDEEQDDDNRK